MSELAEPTPELLVYVFPRAFGLPTVANEVADPFALDPEDALELEDWPEEEAAIPERHTAPAVPEPSFAGAAPPSTRVGAAVHGRVRPVAEAELVSAFYLLHRNGSIRMELERSHRWSPWHVALRTGQEAGVTTGLAADLYRSASRSRTVRDAVYFWVALDMPDPWQFVVDWVTEDGVRRGYLTQPPTPEVGGRPVFRRPIATPIEPLTDPLLPRANAWANEIDRFGEESKELFRHLRSEIFRGLRMRAQAQNIP